MQVGSIFKTKHFYYVHILCPVREHVVRGQKLVVLRIPSTTPSLSVSVPTSTALAAEAAVVRR